ncbi:transglutaminaseTgpA domain-containing protein [Alkanindiges sp. WGS2144]|uniref:transglutaminase family protein n=1 Tax=Alkanindiges sp. WGS2144 TaxID=3366808 RepID=UPI0037512C83
MSNILPPRAVNYRQFVAIVVAQFIVILPHLGHLPPLFSGLGVITLIGLLIMARHKKRAGFNPQPPRIIQYGVVLTGLAIILFTYRTVLGVDAGVAFLTLTLLGKLLELKQRRDAYISLTLSLFVTASLFLFEQSIFNAVMALLAIVAVFYALLQQNINPDVLYHHSARLNVNDAGVMSPSGNLWKPLLRLMLQAIPLLVVLFIFFPRIPPLWSVPISQSQGTTGMTDQMSPGNIASLSQSTELAFRVIDPQNNMRKNLPSRTELYWRGLVLSQFDGVTWTPLRDYRADNPVWSGMQYQPEWFKQNFPAGLRSGFSYQVILEPTRQNWLYGLDIPLSNSAGVGLTREFNLKNSREVYRRFSYNVEQLQGLKRDVELPDWLAKTNLQLPANINPRSRKMAQQVFAQVGQNPRQYANYWLNWIRRENFVYTLEPPVLTGQRIDQFLFESRRGFCEHYSSAYAFLMRAVGIPARVVVGYQGGQFSPDQQSWEVRQLDAHAWVEIWLADEGWVRVDPTAAVAPERVEQGMSSLVQQDQRIFGGGAFNQLRQNQFRLLSRVRTWADYAGYIWQRDVVGFDQSSQQSLLQRLLGIKSMYVQVLWMLGLFLILISTIVGAMWWKRRKFWHPLDRPLQRLSGKLKKQRLERHESEGVVHWLQRLADYPEYQKSAIQLLSLYQQARYNTMDDPTSQAAIVKKMNKLVSSWPNKL